MISEVSIRIRRLARSLGNRNGISRTRNGWTMLLLGSIRSIMRICIVTRPSHPSLIGGSLPHTQSLTLFHSKRARDVTALLYALNRFALRLAGHQSPRHVVRDGTALLKVVSVECVLGKSYGHRVL